MRPARFQTFAVDTLKNAPGVARVQTLAEAGDGKYPFGVSVVTADGETRWQIMGQLADGERHKHDDQPVEGIPATWAGETKDRNAWLAATVASTECPEIAGIETWEGSASSGVRFSFHNGARAFVRKI